MADCYLFEILDYLYYGSSEISNVCSTMEGQCFQAMKIVHQHANGRFDWLISGHQIVNPLREAIYLPSRKDKGFMFFHPVALCLIATKASAS